MNFQGWLKQSTSVNITVLIIDSSDHITGKTGATLTIYLTKAAGTPASIAPTVTELDSTNVKGLYKIALATTSWTDTVGEMQLHITGTGCDPADYKWQVVTRLPDDLAFPATSGRSMVVDASGLIDANVVKVGPTGSGTAQTAGDIPARLPAALTANGNMKSSMVEILTTALTETAGLLAGGFKKFFNVASPTLTCLGVDQTGDSFARIGAAGAGLTNIDLPDQTMNITGNITGNLSGSVGSVTGAVGSVTGAVGSVTGNVGGNVVGSVASVTARVTANTDQLGGSAQSATDLKDFADTGYDPATHKVAGVVLVDTLTTYTGNTPQTGDSFALANGASGFVAIKGDTAAILDDTGTSGVVLSTATKQAIADSLLARSLAGSANGGRTVSQALSMLRNKSDIIAGVLTVYEDNDSTPLWEANVTTAAGNPLSAVSPTT